MKNTGRTLSISIAMMLLMFTASCSSSVVAVYQFYERTKAGLNEKSIQTGNHKIVYHEGGKGETLVLVHGFSADKGNWTKLAYYLTSRYHLIVPDLPGFGESTRLWDESYDIDSQVKRLHAFLNKLGLKKYHITGNSMGGAIAGVYAATYPDEILSLTLISPSGINSPESSDMTLELKKGINPLIVESEPDFDRLLNFVFVNPPKIPGALKSYFIEMANQNSKFNKKVFTEIKRDYPLEKSMKNIKAKTIIIWGDTDRVLHVSGARVLNKGIKNSKLVIMERCGHTPAFERPEETAKHMLEFL